MATTTYIKDIDIVSGGSTNSYLIEPALYGAASTSDSGSTYTVTMPSGFTLITGATIQVKFAVTNAVNATLKVNTLDAKSIYYNNEQIAANTFKANHIYTLVYDGSKWQVVGDIDTNTQLSIGTGANQAAAGNHGHGNISNGGALSAANQAVVTDGSNKITTEDLSSSTPAASGTATAFVTGVTQNAKGKLTSITKANLPTASDSVAGITKLGATGGAATYGHTHGNINNDGTIGTANAIRAVVTNASNQITTDNFAQDSPVVPTSGTTTSLEFIDTVSQGASGKITATKKKIPNVSKDTAGLAPKGAAVSTQSQSTKFLREDGSWAAPSYTTNTNNAVTQTGNTENKEFSILLKNTNNTTDETAGVKYGKTTNKLVTVNPSTGIISAVGGNFSGNVSISGNVIFPNANILDWNGATYRQRIVITDDSTADTAVFTFQQSANNGSSYTNLFTIKDNGTVVATLFSGSGASLTSLPAGQLTGTIDAARLPTSGATAGSYGPSTAVTGNNNATMDVPYITVDNKGRITSISNKVYTAVNTWRGISDSLEGTSSSISASSKALGDLNTKVNGLLAAADAMIFKGTLGTGGTITELPATHGAGDTYRVITAGTWAGKYCEVGTLIICIKDGTVAADADWTSVETNEDGAVIGPTSSTDNAIVRWDGTSGRIIQNSGITIDDNGNLVIAHATSATMTTTSTNPQIIFSENGGQPVHLIYSDYDSYRAPAGLKIIGGTSATPAWLEVEGNTWSAGFKITGKTTSLTDNNLTFSQGGGWSMSDSTWIRTVGGKSVYQNSGILRTDGTLQVGADGNYVSMSSSGIKLGSATAASNGANLITVNGHMVVNAAKNTSNSWNEGIRINNGSNNWSSLVLGGDDGTTTGCSSATWSLHTNRNDTTNKLSQFYLSYNGSSSAATRIQGYSAMVNNTATGTGFSIHPRLTVNATLDTNYNFKVSGTSVFTSTTWVQGPLRIGNADTAGTETGQNGYANANSGSTNYIAFYGVYGDNPGSFNHTYIGESIYGSKTTTNEQSELLLFHGNDPASGSGPDRIRLFAGQIDICIYTAATSGTWDAIRQTAGTKVANFANGQVTITGNLLPEANNTRNIGSSSVKWANVYATTFTGNLTGNVTGNVSGTALNVTGTVAIEHGGTNATTAAGARTNLGLGSIATYGAATAGTKDTWGLVPVIGASDGVMEIGKYIDFHTTDGNTKDYDVRITAATTGLTISGTTSGTFSGNLTGNVTGNITGDLTGTASNVTTTEDTTNTLYPVGIISGVTTTLKHDTNIQMKGGEVNTSNGYKIGTKGAVWHNGSNLWIGATALNENVFTGNLYLNGGLNSSGKRNRAVYISLGASDNVTTGTNYPIVHKDAAGGANAPIYVDANGKTVACTTYANASVNYANSAGAVAWGNVSNKPTKITLTGAVTGNVSLGAGELSLATTVNHGHGNITSDGKIGSAGKKKLVIVGTDNKVTTGAEIDTSTTNQWLNKKGEWSTPPNDNNKVTQSSNNEDKEFPILLKNTNNTTDETQGVKYVGGVTVNPSLKTITATEFIGAIKSNKITPAVSKTYSDTSFYGTSDAEATCSKFFISVKPDGWYKPWQVRFKVRTYAPAHVNADTVTWCTLNGRADGIIYANWNERYDVGHYYIVARVLKNAGFNAGLGHAVGVNIRYSTGRGNSEYYKTIELEYYDCSGCTVTVLDNAVLWANWTNGTDANYNSWSNFDAVNRGLRESGDDTGDNSDRTLQEARYMRMKSGAAGIGRFTIFMEESTGVYSSITTTFPSNNTPLSTLTMNTGVKYKLNRIFYHNQGANRAANTNMDYTDQYWQQYDLIDGRFSFQFAAGALTARAPFYMVGTLDEQGFFTIDAAATAWTQTLPTTENGKAYVFMGTVYPDSSTYRIAFEMNHPIYAYIDGAIREIQPGHSSSTEYARAMKIKGGRISTPTTAHTAIDYSKMYLLISSSTMGTNRPKYSLTGGAPEVADGFILDFHWDNGGDYRQQLALTNSGNVAMSLRGNTNGTWSDWTPVLTTTNVITGGTNGTIKFGGTEVAVKGLGSAAYTASTAYATAAQGTTADNALARSGGKMTGNITGNAAVALGTTAEPFHNIVLGGAASATMTATSTNPRITFQADTGTQPVHLIYTDYDSYRYPAGLKLIGDSGATSSPAWFEVEGVIYSNGLLGVNTGLTRYVNGTGSTNNYTSAAFGGTAINISSSIYAPTTGIQLIAGTGGNTNSTAIGFHNPNVSSAVFGYFNLDANTGLFKWNSDDTYWYLVTGSKKLSTAWNKGDAVIGSDGQDKVVLGYLGSSTNGAVVGSHNSDLSAWSVLNICGSSINFRLSETIRAKIVDGCLSLFPNNSGYREGIRIHSAGSWSDITLCGNDNTGDSGITANSWFIGNNNGNFYITRNGSSSSSSAILSCVSNVWSWNGTAIGSISGNAGTVSHTLATTTKYYIGGTTLTASGSSAITFDTSIYTTTTAGELSAVRHSYNVSGTEKAYTTYNSTDNSIDFIFL